MKTHTASSLLLLVLPLLFLPMSLPAQTLIEGKIFSSAEQRQYLDYRRKDFLEKNRQANFNVEEALIPDIPGAAPNAPSGPTAYSLDGIMTRADGRLTIWLNHQPLTEQQLPSNIHVVHEGGTLALRVNTNGRSQLLRPGQTIEVASGTVQERLHKSAPAPAAPVVPPPEKAASEPTTAPKQQADGIAEKTTDASAKSGDKPATIAANGKTTTPSSANKNPQSLIDSLPMDVRKDPKTLDLMIESLQTLRDGIDENENQ